MRQIRDVLRLAVGQQRSVREVARSLGLGHTTVSGLLRRAREANLYRWPLPEELDETELERRLYPGNQGRPHRRPEPDWSHLDAELRAHKGVTLELLWMEYKREHPDGLQYSQFCVHFALWRGKVDLVMRQSHRAGEKMFVDYAGPKVPILDRRSRTVRFAASIFVAVMGASSYIFLEAHPDQTLPYWLQGHVHAFEHFGGVSELVVPDNPKTGVIEASWYEPVLNPSYADLAAHYGTTILPARPRRPRDKAIAEVSVQVAERWVLAVLRHHEFFSLDELNRTMAEELARVNDRPFRKREGSRRSVFMALDRPALRPLPPTPYEFAEWRRATVNIDYHVEVDHNYYSVPHALVGLRLDVRLSAGTVEILHKGQRVASWPRQGGRGQFSTLPEHMPSAHRLYLDWPPSRLIRWGHSVGPRTGELIEAILATKPHPEQGYRRCMGILGLGKRYEAERLEAAAGRALLSRAYSYRSLRSILERGLDRLPLPPEASAPATLGEHANVRGAGYFAPKGGSTPPC
jgi:transposase